MIDLFQVALELQAFLLSRTWRFCFIGGLALQRWGEPRVTQDVDCTLLTGFGAAVRRFRGGHGADARTCAGTALKLRPPPGTAAPGSYCCP